MFHFFFHHSNIRIFCCLSDASLSSYSRPLFWNKKTWTWKSFPSLKWNVMKTFFCRVFLRWEKNCDSLKFLLIYNMSSFSSSNHVDIFNFKNFTSAFVAYILVLVLKSSSSAIICLLSRWETFFHVFHSLSSVPMICKRETKRRQFHNIKMFSV